MGSATDRGWILPLDTDLVRQLPAELGTLMDQVATDLGVGTAWTPLTMLAGFTTGASGTVDQAAAKRIGEVIYLRGHITRTAGTWPAASTACATLPPNMRPSSTYVGPVSGNASATANGTRVGLSNTTDTLSIVGIGAASNDAWLTGVSYPRV